MEKNIFTGTNKQKTSIKPFFLFVLFVSIFGISNGCASLPNVSEVID